MNELTLLTHGTNVGTLATENYEAELSLPNLRPRTILVPFDFSNVSAALVTRLVPLAEKIGATLHLIHVVEPSVVETGDRQGISAADDARARAAHLQLEQWIKLTLSNQVSITTAVRVGRAVDEIFSQVREAHADLIVMSAHVGNGLKNVLQRTTTERVVRLAPCPVLVVGRDKVNQFLQNTQEFPPSSWKRILLPVDFFNPVPAALSYAAAIALANSARLHVVHAVTSDAGEDAQSVENRLTEWLRAELPEPVEFSATVWTTMPLLQTVLTEASRTNTDAIILPTRVRAWAQRYRLWSVTDGILRHAPCPVLCVNESANALGRQSQNFFNQKN